ncbi:MAG: histidinol-phosphate transaminase [Candidatus Binatia bacterium]
MKIGDQVPEHIRSLVPYTPGKPIEEVERECGITGSVKLASNENPLGPSPRALKMLKEKLSQVHRYPDGDCFYLKHGLARKLEISPSTLIFGNGSNELIELAVRTFLRPGEEAVMANQAFVIYRLVTQAAGGSCKMIPLRNFTHDLTRMREAVTPKTRIVFLSNPNNPTGTIYRKQEWEKFLEQVSPEILLVADEAYYEYVTDSEYPDSLRYQGRYQNILTLRTFSKMYGLAGLRIGYGVGPEPVIAMMQRVRQPFNVNAAAQWAALAALDDDEHKKRTLDVNRQGMEFMQHELKRLGMDYVPSQANFLLVHVGDGSKVFEALLRRGVIVRPMKEYDFPEYIRVTVGTAEENAKFIQEFEAISSAMR